MATPSGNQPKKKKGGLAGNKWVWIGGGLLLLIVGYEYLKNSGSLSSVSTTATNATPSAGTSTDTTGQDTGLGLNPSAGAPTDNGATTSDYLSTLGQSNSDLLSALSTQSQNIAQIASSQISNLQANTTAGSFPTQTSPSLSMQPGGSQAPVINFYASSTTPTGAAPSTTSSHPSTSPTKYYTYKSQVPLSSGQTLHFSSGKGYYAAAG